MARNEPLNVRLTREGLGGDGVHRQQVLQLAGQGQNRLVVPLRKPKSGGAQLIDFLFDTADHPLPLGFDVDCDGRRHPKSLGSGLDHRRAVVDQHDIRRQLLRKPDHLGLSLVQSSALRVDQFNGKSQRRHSQPSLCNSLESYSGPQNSDHALS